MDLAAMSNPRQSGREWATGLAVLIATIISCVGFAHISYKWTLVISVTLLTGLVLFFWRVGVRKRRSRHRSR